MKNINKINFEDIRDLRRVLKIPKQGLSYLSYKELSEIMKKSSKIVTVHLYPFFIRNYKENCLLDLNRWSYHQIYLCIHEDKIYWCFGHGDTSHSRECHNGLIEIFLKDKKLRERTISAIIISYKGEILSYYFYEHYSYSNQDIGSNWRLDIRDRLKSSKICERKREDK